MTKKLLIGIGGGVLLLVGLVVTVAVLMGSTSKPAPGSKADFKGFAERFVAAVNADEERKWAEIDKKYPEHYEREIHTKVLNWEDKTPAPKALPEYLVTFRMYKRFYARAESDPVAPSREDRLATFEIITWTGVFVYVDERWKLVWLAYKNGPRIVGIAQPPVQITGSGMGGEDSPEYFESVVRKAQELKR